MSRILTLSILTTALLAGCSNTGYGPNPIDAEVDAAVPPPPCLADNPTNGAAWIDKMPGMNSNPTLHIKFTVDAPNEGDEYELVFDAAQESAPPSYIYHLKRSKAGALRVITETDLKFAFAEFAEPKLRSVIILCGGEPFLDIEPVEIVQ